MRKSQNFKVFSYLFMTSKDGDKTDGCGIVFIRRIKAVFGDMGETCFIYNISVPTFDGFGNLELIGAREKWGKTEAEAFFNFLRDKYENPFLVYFKQVKI